MNKVIFMGRLTKDIDNDAIKYTSGDNATCIVRFSIAVDKRFKNKNDPNAPTADFFNITCFGKTAEFAKNYLGKGSKVVIEGRIENNNYTDANGNKVYRDQIVAESIEFAESKKAAENNVQAPVNQDNSFVNIPDGNELESELPFK